jgi:hypothetical protein
MAHRIRRGHARSILRGACQVFAPRIPGSPGIYDGGRRKFSARARALRHTQALSRLQRLSTPAAVCRCTPSTRSTGVAHACSAIEYPAAAVRNGAAVTCGAGFRYASTAIGDIGASARCRHRTPSAIQHAATPVGHRSAVGAERGARRRLASAMIRNPAATAGCGRGAVPAALGIAASVGNDAALRIQLRTSACRAAVIVAEIGTRSAMRPLVRAAACRVMAVALATVDRSSAPIGHVSAVRTA